MQHGVQDFQQAIETTLAATGIHQDQWKDSLQAMDSYELQQFFVRVREEKNVRVPPSGDDFGDFAAFDAVRKHLRARSYSKFERDRILFIWTRFEHAGSALSA